MITSFMLNRLKLVWGALLGLMINVSLLAQAPMPAKSAAEIQHALKKLQTVGSVLYLAAHPDDENQRIIAYYAKGKGYRTAYLALTRGDGGQNLIGGEIGPHLGMLRTQELLAARRIDGGEQMFSRAYDFGYSKGPEETLEIWDREKVLGDVVWAIRKFRPDVIITRFATPEKGGGGHGHHTTSAILAHEAFSLAADPKAYPEQLKHVETWQPKRLLWNNYWVFRRYQPTDEEKKGIATVNVGEWNPLLGESYGEMAMRARSMHKCQAFGAPLLHGDQIEYLEQELGEPMEGNQVMSGVDTSWDRVPGAGKLGKLLAKAYAEFNAENPAASVPVLMEAYGEMEGKSGYWYEVKRKELKDVIIYCAGLYFELNSAMPQVATGDSAAVTARYLLRDDLDIQLRSLVLAGQGFPLPAEEGKLVQGKLYSDKLSFPIKQEPGQPYWLKNPQAKGIFDVREQTLIGLPENPPALEGTFVFTIGGQEITFRAPVVHRYVDPAVGELYRPFIVAPQVAVNISKKVYLFAGDGEQEVQLQVKSFGQPGTVSLSFETPKGWKVSPETLELTTSRVGEEQIVTVSVSAPSTQSQ
ncbi:MAG: PIG-L family deacetylase, partial [Bacteroidota bacterium]